MLLPQTKEREYRFKLSLRMVLPIFALVGALVFHTFTTSQDTLSGSFYVESILILVFSIYFIFYLIYKGFDTKITDNISKAFTREYMYDFLNRELQNHKEYTLLLISIDNLYEINERYGIKNGDKILYETVLWTAEYLKTKGIYNFPIGHIKGGDFIIGLKGSKNQYKSVMELMCIKSEEFKVDDIEVQISGAINDIAFSSNLDYLIENLFELQSKKRDLKVVINQESEINPSDLEFFVINAIKRRDLTLITQDVFENQNKVLKECFIKLNAPDGKLLHQKNYMKILDKLRLMHEYDLMVLEKIADICKKTADENYAITISPTSIRNPIVLSKIKDLFYKNESLKGRITLLFSESEYFPKIDKFNTILQQLRDLGIFIGIDRLGSLHTSFLYLRDLNIDIVRFDTFYSRETDENRSKYIISGFNTMAHEKGVKTWIKMVENKSVANMAEELKIDYMQGKYIAPLKKN